MPDRRARLRRIGIGITAGALPVLIVLLGVLNPPRPEGVFTDHLGPDQGEAVADYLARARDSLRGADDAEHWALVSFTEHRPATALPALARGLRIGQVIYHVPIERVATPLVIVPVPANERALLRSGVDAATELLDRRQRSAGPDERTTRVLDVSITRLLEGRACVVGLVVRAPLNRLRELAEQPGIRAVQALPADAVAGRFAVVPLFPTETDIVGPTPDDGPVPPR
ncbi:hypothetical protein [Nocardia paucivorans]|uniref:hypothetical protein n=1 Tax=Nocardia paucivorans TaxID=114259 RepID=UPI00031470A9|nr:hypothetical protein [Nocardia paucivorans]